MYMLTLDAAERRALLSALGAMRESIVFDDLPTDTVDSALDRIETAVAHRRPRDLFRTRFEVYLNVSEKKLVFDALYDKLVSDRDKNGVNEALLRRLDAERKEVI